MDYDHRGDGVPTNLPGDFNGDAAADDKPNRAASNYREKRSRALKNRVNVLWRADFAESFDQSYSLRLAFYGVRRLIAAFEKR